MVLELILESFFESHDRNLTKHCNLVLRKEAVLDLSKLTNINLQLLKHSDQLYKTLIHLPIRLLQALKEIFIRVHSTCTILCQYFFSLVYSL